MALYGDARAVPEDPAHFAPRIELGQRLGQRRGPSLSRLFRASHETNLIPSCLNFGHFRLPSRCRRRARVTGPIVPGQQPFLPRTRPNGSAGKEVPPRPYPRQHQHHAQQRTGGEPLQDNCGASDCPSRRAGPGPQPESEGAEHGPHRVGDGGAHRTPGGPEDAVGLAGRGSACAPRRTMHAPRHSQPKNTSAFKR